MKQSTILDTIQQRLSADIKRLNERISTQLGSSNRLMNEVIEAYLRTKGKQIRPIVVMLSAGMFGRITDKVISAAAAVDLLHNASLIHDDVVDQSKMRRNHPTINSVWDNHVAVLVGDFFVSSSMQQAISTGDVKIIDALCMLGKTLSLGEIDQIYNARYHTLDEEAYFRIITHKTASLFIACARMGSYAVDAPADSTERLAEFARLLGICFQLRDDVFDYFPSDVVGKPTGNDLREGKITLPLLYALGRTDMPECEAMRELAYTPELDADQIAVLTDYARRGGGIDYTFATMHRLRDEAAAILADLPASPVKDDFMALFDYIIARDY